MNLGNVQMVVGEMVTRSKIHETPRLLTATLETYLMPNDHAHSLQPNISLQSGYIFLGVLWSINTLVLYLRAGLCWVLSLARCSVPSCCSRFWIKGLLRPRRLFLKGGRRRRHPVLSTPPPATRN